MVSRIPATESGGFGHAESYSNRPHALPRRESRLPLAVLTAMKLMRSAQGEPLPFRVEFTDLESLESTVRAFRALDYRHGGESCRAALTAIGSWTALLRTGHVPARLARRLSVA